MALLGVMTTTVFASTDDCDCAGKVTVNIQIATMSMTLDRTIGGFGFSDGLFHSPGQLGVFQHSFFAADLRNRRVQRFRDTGVFEFTTQAVKTPDGDDTTMQGPFSIAVDPRGAVYVGDLDDNVIYRLDTYGRYQETWGQFGVLGVRFNQPMGLFVDIDGYVWVADFGNSRVLKLDESGKQALEIDALEGGLSSPVDVWVESNRQVWILDENGLKLFDEFGKFKRQVIAVSGASSVTQWINKYWVLTFPIEGAIRVYSYTGELIKTVKDPFKSPIDVIRLGDDRLLISDRGAHRVWLFSIH